MCSTEEHVMKNKKEFMWFCIPSDFIIDRKQLVKVITKIGKPHKFKDPVSLLTYLDLSGNSRNRLYYIQHKGNLFHTYIATRRVLMGREELLAEAFLLGGHGGVCGGANLIPELYVELYNAACSKDLPKVESLHKKVMEFNTAVYHVGHYESSLLKGLKCALSCVGICSDFLAEPFHRFRRAEHEVIERYVKELGIDPKK